MLEVQYKDVRGTRMLGVKGCCRYKDVGGKRMLGVKGCWVYSSERTLTSKIHEGHKQFL